MSLIMKMRGIIITTFLFFIPMSAFSAWSVSTPAAAAPGGQPFFPTGPQKITVYKQQPAAPFKYMTPQSVYMPEHATSAPTTVMYPSSVSRSMAFPNQVAFLPQTPKPQAIYAVSISGSLKENLERIMSRYRWRVVWKANYDYNFDGRITGTSLPDVIKKLLKPFPLQAVMYMSNRTLVIVPRDRI